jgi:hypothetical protein
MSVKLAEAGEATEETKLAKVKPAATTPPSTIKLGRVKKSQIKKLTHGHGKLMEEVIQIAQGEIAKLPDPGEGKAYQPVVILYHRKPKSNKRKVNVLGATLDRKKLRKSGIDF